MTKLSKTMQEAFDGMVGEFERAQNAGSFEAWYAGSDEKYAELASMWDSKYTGKRHETRMRLIDEARERYQDALDGFVLTGAGYGTLKALERRRYIEIAPATTMYRVKLLTI